MINIYRGEIWLVNLDPTVGHEVKKTRPALIIQNDIGNRYSPITILAPITSQRLDAAYPVEVVLPSATCGLEKESKALLNQIRVIDKKRLVKRLGRIDALSQRAVDDALKISLGLVEIG